MAWAVRADLEDRFRSLIASRDASLAEVRDDLVPPTRCVEVPRCLKREEEKQSI
jgi:hypothetical protein